jgi:KDO2-lipid IV(A) lauroyltransferase
MYYFFILGKFIAAHLPRSACYALAEFLATLQFYFSKKDRQAVIYNLSAVIKDKIAVKRSARQVFINFAYYLTDFFRYSKLNADFIKKYVTISGLDKLNDSLTKNKGIIAVTAHIGNYEMAGAVTALLGYPVDALVLPHQDRRLTDFFIKQRKLAGINVLLTTTGLKKCFSSIRQGKLIAFLGDRDFFGGGLTIEMFSRRCILPRGPAFFALRTNTNIIPAFFIRKNKKFYHLIFEEAIAVGEPGLKTEEAVIGAYAKILERYIAKYPDQWYMFQRYWL